MKTLIATGWRNGIKNRGVSPRNCLNPILSKLDKQVVLLPVNF